MLYIPGVSDTYSKELDVVLSRASVETTPDGFEYFVADPNEQMGLTMGSVFRTPEQSDLTLVINGNVAQEDRQKIATASMVGEFHLDADRYWLALALHEVLGWNDDAGFNKNIRAINIMFDALRAQSAAIQQNPEVDAQTKARLRLEARSAMGVLATYRGVTDIGLEAYGEFNKQGLWIPHANVHEVELAGYIQTINGTVGASFKSMEEKSERHHCAGCSNQIIRGTTRVTLGLDTHDGYSDHHHYHYPCFIDKVIPKLDIGSITERPMKLH
jgi:hypothetical protein